jgi:RND family efflux transporter MFP subunit
MTDMKSVVPDHNEQPTSMGGRFLPAVFFVAIGVLIAFIMIKTKPSAKKIKRKNEARIVEVIKVKREAHQAKISAMGTVIPAEEVTLQPRVSGRVIWLSENLEPGSVVKKDEVLLRIDPKPFELVIEQRKAEVAKAEYQYKLELGQQDIAKREWQLSNKNGGNNKLDMELTLRKPHLKNYKAALSSAQARLEQAKLELEWTTVHAPFDAVIRSKDTAIGAQVSTQTQLATLAGAKVFWINSTLPVSDLKWIAFPDEDKNPSSHVSIWVTDSQKYEGKIIRRLPDLESEGRLAQILIEVKNPLEEKKGQSSALLLGSYVRLDIEGRTMKDVIKLPRKAIKDNNFIWLMKDGKLHFHKISPIWTEREYVVISNGLKNGDKVIISEISTPVENMDITTLEESDINKSTKKTGANTPEEKSDNHGK